MFRAVHFSEREVEGEPVGKLTWAYDGEAFCDGIYEVGCAKCSRLILCGWNGPPNCLP